MAILDTLDEIADSITRGAYNISKWTGKQLGRGAVATGKFAGKQTWRGTKTVGKFTGRQIKKGMIAGGRLAGRGIANAGIVMYDMINDAIKYGAEEISRAHPEISKDYISENVDGDRLYGVLLDKLEEIPDEKLPRDVRENLSRLLADYVLSGQALTPEGKNKILEYAHLRKKANSGLFDINSIRARREYMGLKSLDRKIEAFEKVSKIAEHYGIEDERIKEPLEYLKRANFGLAALRSLRNDEIISGSDYRRALKRVERESEEVKSDLVSRLGNYSTYNPPSNETFINNSPYTASILATIGLGIFFLSGTKVTGNVIGAAPSSILPLIGMLSLVLSGILFLRSFKN